MGQDVVIFDTTLRDGEQAPGNSMTPEAKLRLARQLDLLGVDVIEAGFPSASDGDARAVRAIADEVRRPVIAALARCHDRDIDLAGEALRGGGRRAGASTSSSPPPTCTSSTSCGSPARTASPERARRSSGRGASPTTWSSPPRTPRAAI